MGEAWRAWRALNSWCRRRPSTRWSARPACGSLLESIQVVLELRPGAPAFSLLPVGSHRLFSRCHLCCGHHLRQGHPQPPAARHRWVRIKSSRILLLLLLLLLSLLLVLLLHFYFYFLFYT